MARDLSERIDAALKRRISAGLKSAIDTALAEGATKRGILARARKAAGGRTPLVLAIEAYLGCAQDGESREDGAPF